MQYIIRGKSFVFTTEIRDNTTLRKSFFSLARQTFDLDFEPWYQCGGWQDRYLPHALVCGEQVAPMYRSTGWIFSWTVGAESICSWAPS